MIDDYYKLTAIDRGAGELDACIGVRGPERHGRRLISYVFPFNSSCQFSSRKALVAVKSQEALLRESKVEFQRSSYGGCGEYNRIGFSHE